jgi:DNA invertase Pin-like site-specific DNA recombinase
MVQWPLAAAVMIVTKGGRPADNFSSCELNPIGRKIKAPPGRKRSIDPKTIADLKAQKVGATEIARQLGIGRASVYRVLGEG